MGGAGFPWFPWLMAEGLGASHPFGRWVAVTRAAAIFSLTTHWLVIP